MESPGERLPAPFAHYDHDSSTWKTSETSLFEDLTSSSPTWPRSGTWDLGRAYERPTSALAIGVIDGSPLPTPTAADHKRRGVHEKGGNPTLPHAVEALLPTPQAADSNGHHTRGGDRSHELLLPGVARKLLPTPTADSGPNRTVKRSDPQSNHHDGLTLKDWVKLLPTPDAAVSNDGEDLDTWQARRSELAARHGNNGMGTPLAIAVRLLPTPTARLGDESSRGADPARYRGPKSLNGRRSNLDDAIAAVDQQAPWLGDSSPPQSPDGSPSPE